ncbi:endolytic transglycosylase MltG [Streptomyces bambusae]|uniref:endolytic transglycosylase MltG n=1 Tax=Streptomyces bambusae TaxID=1550616 RepID=UPI0027E20A36|nr:endolytic transglycosylase MltG [Streptomyces bambusae]
MQQHGYPQEQFHHDPLTAPYAQADGTYGGQQQYAGQQFDTGQYPAQYPGHHPQQPGGYPDQQYPGQYADQYPDQYPDQYGQQHQQLPPQQYADPHGYGNRPREAAVPAAPHYGGGTGGWDGGVPDAYGQQPASGYPGEAPDLYGTSEAYPPPQPPNRRVPAPEPAPEWQDDDPAADEPEHAFFAGGGDGSDGGDDDGDAPDDRGRGDSGRRGGSGRTKGKPKKKGRNGVACLFVSLVLVGGIGGIGYYGYSFVQERFGAPEDYTGAGTGTVEVEIPKGASLAQMGGILKEAGVVKSTDAFTAAAQQHSTKGLGIQPGLYVLKKEMSAAAAVELMVNPSNINALDVNPAQRNVRVYENIDKKLKKPEGTTREIAKKQWKTLGLPAWATPAADAKDPLEGFLYPGRYDLGKDVTPEKLLKQMVSRASSHYNSLDLEPKARAMGLKSPLELLTVASLVAAEGKTAEDYKKMSEVVYNRLKRTNDQTNRKLQFDSTINYIKDESTVDITSAEAQALKDPYNTYVVEGLPPGPIGNPGDDAVRAAFSPDKGGWMFFITLDNETTKFTKTFAEHNKLVAEFNKKRQSGG